MRKNKKFIVLFSLVCLMILALPFSLQAKSSMQQNVYVSSDEEIRHNFAVAGQSVELAGHFHKDVYVWGNSVIISGIVEGDVVAAGSYVRVSGEVKGNIRAVGSNIELDAKVGKNATVAGGLVFVRESAEIGWDLLVAGGVVNVYGPVNGMIQAAAGNLEINSLVGQGVNAKIDSDGQFILKPKAEIKGNVYYTWDEEVKIDQAKVEGEIKRSEPAYTAAGPDVKSLLKRGYWGYKLYSFAALLLIGLLLVAFTGKFSEKVAARSIDKFGLSLGMGFLFLVLVPIAFIVLLITLIGIPLAFILLALYFILLYIAKVYASLMVGTLLLGKLLKKKKVDKYLAFLVGLIVLSVIGLIPFFGGLIWFVLSLAGIGALLIIEYKILKEMK